MSSFMSITQLGSSSRQHAVPPDGAVLGEDFPIVCEDCLGPNPYVRMMKAEMAQECKISGAPFTVFKWQGKHKKWKQTVCDAVVAQEKNVCQASSRPAVPPAHRQGRL